MTLLLRKDKAFSDTPQATLTSVSDGDKRSCLLYLEYDGLSGFCRQRRTIVSHSIHHNAGK